jgi:predicted negative regulator of RcsB-dependent stress response
MKVNPEFLPVVEWWEKDGKQLVVYLTVAAIAVGGWYWWKNHTAAVKAAAQDALVSAYTTEELEDCVSKFAGSATEGALKLRLAKSYYDAGRYEEALAQYEALVGNAPDGFADIPEVGKAQCLEALGKFDEAAKAFDAFAEANPKSYLKLTAQLGAARSFAQAGDKKKALARLDALKAAVKDDALSSARVEATQTAVKRYEKKVAAAAAKLEPAKEAPAAKKDAPAKK